MASILKDVPGAQDVQTGNAYDRREAGTVPIVKFSFLDPSGIHNVQIRIGGSEVHGYGYLQSDIPSLAGNPVTGKIQDEWFTACKADALAFTS